MYNEDEQLFKYTMSGILHSYYALFEDPDVQMTQNDFLIYLICDGYDKIPESFKDYAKKTGFFDEDLMLENGSMVMDQDGQKKLVSLTDIMDEGVEPIDNVYHWFMTTITDFDLKPRGGVELDKLPINFYFCLKQKNDGKVNSHKSTFNALCKIIEPEYI